MARVSTPCVNFTEGSMMERSASSDLSLSVFFITKVVNCVTSSQLIFLSIGVLICEVRIIVC